MNDELSRVRIERDEHKSRASALENELRIARNAESAALKVSAEAEERAERIPALEAEIERLEGLNAALVAENKALLAREARADAIIEDVKALARLVDRA